MVLYDAGMKAWLISSPQPLLQSRMVEPPPLHRNLSRFMSFPDLKITVEEAEAILQQINRPATQNLGMPLTQSVAAVIKSTPKFSTHWPPLDKLLDGGLTRGHILEVSGPPGSPKEDVAIDVATSFIEGGENVIFVGSRLSVFPL